MPSLPVPGAALLALKNKIIKCFGESEWMELGLVTDQLGLIEGHGRLLRSLRFNDDDYDGCVIDVLTTMLRRDPNLYEVIDVFVDSKLPDGGEYVSSVDRGRRRIVFSPQVFDVPDKPVEGDLVAVMMPFAAEFDEVYSTIGAATFPTLLTCVRADDIWENATVIQDVFSLIYRSFIVVCDFTDRNPNVFYEAGIAHTLGKHVIPIAQSRHDIPFDLQHHRFVIYQNNKEGRSTLMHKLVERFETLTGSV